MALDSRPMNASSVFSQIVAATVVGATLMSCSSPQSTKVRAKIETGTSSDSGKTLKSTGYVQTGKASWYSIRTNGGTRTASGQRLSNNAATAAHRSLPMGTMVRVTNLRNGRSQVVKITDRGPFIKGRIIDVTIGIAERLDMVNAGVVPCKVERLELVPESTFD